METTYDRKINIYIYIYIPEAFGKQGSKEQTSKSSKISCKSAEEKQKHQTNGQVAIGI